MDTVSVRLQHGGPPTWERRWRKMLVLFARLDGLYKGTEKVESNEDAEMIVEDFAVAAFHLAEHIEADPALPQPARDGARAACGSGTLKVAADMANTDKHHTRTGGRTVRVSEYFSDGATGGMTMLVTSVPPSGSSTNYDALSFAADCVKQWESYLISQGVGIPPAR